MIESTYIDHHLSSADNLIEPMDLSDSSTGGTSPSSSDFPELLSYSATSSFSIAGDLLLSPVSTVASPPMHHIVKQYAIFQDPTQGHLPSPPNSGKMPYPDWNTSFGMDTGPGPNDDVAIPPEFYMPERCTPDPDSYLSNYPVAESHNSSTLNQSSPYFLRLHQLDNNAHTLGLSSSVAESPSTIETTSRGSAPEEDSRPPIEPHRRNSRTRSVSTTVAKKRDKEYEDSHDAESFSSRRSSSAGVKKLKKKATIKKVASPRFPVIDTEEHKNCYGDLVPPQLKETCPEEERCIFESRWAHRDKKGQDMWDSIQEDFHGKFGRLLCKEALQMKLSRGRAKYIKWLGKDEEILVQAWENVQANHYKAINDEFERLGGSRNMLLNPSDIEVKVVVDLALEEEIYVEGITQLELRRRCRILSGRKKAGGRKGKEEGISYSGPSLFGREVDEDEVIKQVLEKQTKGPQPRQSLGQRRKQSTQPQSRRAPKKIKLESNQV